MNNIDIRQVHVGVTQAITFQSLVTCYMKMDGCEILHRNLSRSISRVYYGSRKIFWSYESVQKLKVMPVASMSFSVSCATGFPIFLPFYTKPKDELPIAFEFYRVGELVSLAQTRIFGRRRWAATGSRFYDSVSISHL